MAVVITRQDGGISIINCDDAVADEEVGKWAQSSAGQLDSYELVPDKDIPAKDDYRDAWILSGKKIEVDATKAAKLKKDKGL